MEVITSLEKYAVNNIIFLNFLKVSNDILDKIPPNVETKLIIKEFEEKNNNNRKKYYAEFKLHFIETLEQKRNQKKNIILDWAKQNEFPLDKKKYDENFLSSLIETKIFPIYNKKIKDLNDTNNLLLKLLHFHVINNLTNSINFLFEIKNMYLHKKLELIEANESIQKLLDISCNNENELKKQNASLQKKISNLDKKIQILSSENQNLKSQKEALSNENYGYAIDIQNNDMEINNLKSEVKVLNKKLEEIKKESEAKIEAVKKESEANKKESEAKIEAVKKESEAKIVKFSILINEFLDKISSDLTQKIGDIKNGMKESQRRKQKES